MAEQIDEQFASIVGTESPEFLLNKTDCILNAIREVRSYLIRSKQYSNNWQDTTRAKEIGNANRLIASCLLMSTKSIHQPLSESWFSLLDSPLRVPS